jgi:hypothetical protein
VTPDAEKTRRVWPLRTAPTTTPAGTHSHPLPAVMRLSLAGLVVAVLLQCAAITVLAIYVVQDHNYVIGRGELTCSISYRRAVCWTAPVTSMGVGPAFRCRSSRRAGRTRSVPSNPTSLPLRKRQPSRPPRNRRKRPNRRSRRASQPDREYCRASIPVGLCPPASRARLCHRSHRLWRHQGRSRTCCVAFSRSAQQARRSFAATRYS